jgi:fructokinase
MSMNIVGIGEVLWDLLPEGPQLGGAPANFAYHAQALGANAAVITRIGNDQRGREVRQRFQEMGLSVAGIQLDQQAPTGTVSVSLTSDGIPAYIIHEDVAWDYLQATGEALDQVRSARVVCFGSLAQRHDVSRRSVQRLLAAAPATAWKTFDVNLRQNFFNRETIESSLRLANVLKLNEHELPVIARMFALEGDSREQIQALVVRFGLQVVALTCGAAGSLLFREGKWAEAAATVVSVKDTVGAGDAFTAALSVGLLRALGLEEINHAANRIAASVCSSAGATPMLPDELRKLLNPDLMLADLKSPLKSK